MRTMSRTQNTFPPSLGKSSFGMWVDSSIVAKRRLTVANAGTSNGTVQAMVIGSS